MTLRNWFRGTAPAPTILICFSPQMDITAFELATILLRTQGVEAMSRIPIAPETWKSLDPCLKRHFVEALV